jgi:hypothetical protein
MQREPDYPDLDALVLAEIESAFSRHRRYTQRLKPTETEPELEPETLSEPANPVEVTRIHGDNRPASGMSGEEAELLDRFPEADGTELDDLPPPSLFSPEEEAFIHRAIGFLSGRENGDMILGQIWERVTRDHPEDFYTTPMEGPAAPPLASDSGEEDGVIDAESHPEQREPPQ